MRSRTIQAVLAQPSGFCAGVERTIQIVERAPLTSGPQIDVRDSCHATLDRQHSVRDLANLGEVILVVGSRHSPTLGCGLIDDAAGVAASWFDGVGVAEDVKFKFPAEVH